MLSGCYIAVLLLQMYCSRRSIKVGPGVVWELFLFLLKAKGQLGGIRQGLYTQELAKSAERLESEEGSL